MLRGNGVRGVRVLTFTPVLSLFVEGASRCVVVVLLVRVILDASGLVSVFSPVALLLMLSWLQFFCCRLVASAVGW